MLTTISATQTNDPAALLVELSEFIGLCTEKFNLSLDEQEKRELKHKILNAEILSCRIRRHLLSQ
jgi:hypothetical protein